jgi:serine/threonine-protein kinase
VELRGIVLGDRYLLDSRIAAGGMGQVWLAADQVLGRLVAVKLLRPEYAEHPETLERFRAEARHAGVLNHPHIAQVYDYGPLHGSRGAAFPADRPAPSREPYLVMEYVNGPSLAEVIEREALSVDFTCDIIAQAAAGLDAAHRAGLVHRDVKPGNLLLTSDRRIKVTDFGIAHAAGSAPITAPGIVMGTSLYMAPERIAGGPGTPASDLYSLGIVMWECLTGHPPFRGASPDVMAAHLHRALPPLPAWVPAPVYELVARLTAKDPGYRLSDAGLLAAQLRSLELVSAGSRDRDPSGYAPALALPPPARSRGAGFPPRLGPGPDLVSPAIGYLSAPAPGAGGVLLDRQRLTEDCGPDPVRVGIPAARPAWGDSDPVPGGGAISAGTSPFPAAGARGAARRPGRPGGRRRGIMAGLAALAGAGLVVAGLAASGALGATHRAGRGLAVPSVPASGTPAGTPVYVRVPSFHDVPYATVASWLRGHGLTAVMAWDDHAGLAVGTVVSVSPSGQVQAGSTVTVTVAWNSAAPPPTAIVSGSPGGAPGRDASPASGSSAAAGGGSTAPGAGTWPGAGSSPTASATAPPAPQPTTSAPTPGSHGTTAAPKPTSSCAFPVGPVCF